MIRRLLATTALASIIATGAFAQATTAPASDTPAAAPVATDTASPAASNTPMASDSTYLQKIGTDEYLASDLAGLTVYQSAAADAESAGKIDNFLVGADGKIAAAIISTSGLDDDKTVAVPFDKLTWSMGEDNEPRAVLTATREELTAAPEFVENTATQAADAGAAAPVTGAAPAGDATVAATTPAAPAAAPMATTENQPVQSAAAMGDSAYPATVAGDQYLTQDIIGSNIYSGPGDDAEKIGSVNDLVLAKNGGVVAAVVGVGGFLGIGEKNVGVPFAELQMSKDDGSEPRTVLAATKDQLTAAPAFETDADEVADNSATAPAATETTSTAAAPVAPTDTTMAAAPAAGTDASSTASTGGATDRASMTPVTGPELTADKLKGTTVYGPNDESIGEVGDIALSQDGQVDAVIVDVGGFLGIGQKQVAVAMDNLQFMKDSGGSMYLYTQFTQDQLKNAPEYNSDTYAENRDQMRIQPGAELPASTPAGTTTTPAANDTMAPAAGTDTPATGTAAPAQ